MTAALKSLSPVGGDIPRVRTCQRVPQCVTRPLRRDSLHTDSGALSFDSANARYVNVAILIAIVWGTEHRGVTPGEIGRCLKMTDAQIRAALRKLERQGRVRRVVSFEPVERGQNAPSISVRQQHFVQPSP